MFIFTFFFYSWLYQVSLSNMNNLHTATTTPGQSGPWSNGNEGALHTLQSSSLITKFSLVSLSGHLIFLMSEESYSFTGDTVSIF